MSDDDKVYTKLKTEVKRGTGTRDQDKTVVTTRNPDPTAAAENHREAVQHLKKFAGLARSVDADADESLLSEVAEAVMSDAGLSTDADDSDDTAVDTSEVPDDLPDPADPDEQDQMDAEDTPADTDDGVDTEAELAAFDADGGDGE